MTNNVKTQASERTRREVAGDTERGNIAAAVNAGIEIGGRYGEVIQHNATYDPIVVFWGPEGPQVVELKKYERERPKLVDLTARFTCPKSFAAYVNEFKALGATRVYCDLVKQSFTAVLDDNESTPKEILPAWRQHVAVYTPTPTEAWKAWLFANKKLMPQVDFAEFVEERLEDIVEPEGAKMLALAQNLQAHRSLTFQSGVHLTSGNVQFQYVEETKSGDPAKQSMTAPERIKVRLQPFISGPQYDFTAAFRYRIEAGGLKMGYSIFHLESFMEQCLGQLAESIGKELADVPVLMGSVTL